MATKKKTKKKPAAPKPFGQGEVINFPCGAKVVIDNWGTGGVILGLQLSSHSPEVKFCISDDALRMLPALSKRGLATVKLAEPEQK